MFVDSNTIKGLAMLRNDWKFSYSTATLLEAAKNKVAYRTGRAEFWQTRLEEAMTELRSSGIEVTQSVAASYGSHSNSRRGTAVKLDEAITDKIEECQEKLKEHKTEAAAYAGWVEVFAGNPDTTLELKYGDWLYFFGKDA